MAASDFLTSGSVRYASKLVLELVTRPRRVVLHCLMRSHLGAILQVQRLLLRFSNETAGLIIFLNSLHHSLLTN